MTSEGSAFCSTIGGGVKMISCVIVRYLSWLKAAHAHSAYFLEQVGGFVIPIAKMPPPLMTQAYFFPERVVTV